MCTKFEVNEAMGEWLSCLSSELEELTTKMRSTEWNYNLTGNGGKLQPSVHTTTQQLGLYPDVLNVKITTSKSQVKKGVVLQSIIDRISSIPQYLPDVHGDEPFYCLVGSQASGTEILLQLIFNPYWEGKTLPPVSSFKVLMEQKVDIWLKQSENEMNQKEGVKRQQTDQLRHFVSQNATASVDGCEPYLTNMKRAEEAYDRSYHKHIFVKALWMEVQRFHAESWTEIYDYTTCLMLRLNEVYFKALYPSSAGIDLNAYGLVAENPLKFEACALAMRELQSFLEEPVCALQDAP